MAKTQLLALVAFLCTAFSGFSQDYVDLGKFHYANTPVNQFDSATKDTRIREYGLDATLPIKLKSGNAVVTGIYFEQISTNVSPDNSNLTNVFTINPKLGMSINHNDKWTGTYMLLPKLSSDMKGFSSKDFQLGAVVLMKYHKSENTKYKFGMYYNSELFGPFFVPILGLYHQSTNKKWEINASLPISADVNRAWNEKWRTGMNFFAFVRSFHLHEPYQGNPNNYLVKTTNEVFAYMQYHATKSLIIQGKVGYSIGRNYRIYDVQDQITWGLSAAKFGDDRKQLNTDFADGMIFRLKLIYRYHL